MLTRMSEIIHNAAVPDIAPRLIHTVVITICPDICLVVVSMHVRIRVDAAGGRLGFFCFCSVRGEPEALGVRSRAHSVGPVMRFP
jgi:hypothetical protein